MGKRLADIRQEIDKVGTTFKSHLEKTLDKSVFDLLDKLSRTSQVYIFSGIIRNYFLKISDYRDIDIFIDGEVDIEAMIKIFKYRRNSFGGYKITVGNTNIDLWFLHDTWALNNSQRAFEFELAKYIPNTAFFNFSSIMFSFNEGKFYYTKFFTRFLRDKKIDLVYKPNANYALCVVNSFYYSDKFKLKLTDKLKNHLKILHKASSDKYEDAQLKHFKKVLYKKDDIERRINLL